MQMKRAFFMFMPLALWAVPQLSFAAAALYLGSSGSAVVTLQNQLTVQGYLAAGNATGYYGAKTQAAVEQFQCDKKIACSAAVQGYGVYGPKTQAALAAVAQPAQPTSINTAQLTPKATGKFEVSAWVPYWNKATSTADAEAHLSQVTSIMPFAYTVNPDGTLMDTAQFLLTPWPAFIAQAKAAHVRVVPTVLWGDGSAEQAILSNAASRVALEDTIASLVKQKGFDGIDIDFEAKQADTINYFSTFLKGLYARMGNKWVYCTVESRMPLEDRYPPGATVPPDANERANDFTALNQYCDRVEIMAYDQGTVDVRLDAARSAPYAPVADPGWVSDLVTLAAQSISRNKLIIGIPTYGYEYTVTPQGDGSFKYQTLWALTQKYALEVAAQLGINAYRTSADEAGFTYDPAQLSAAAPQNGDTTQTQQQSPTTTVTQNLGSQLSGNQPFNYITWSDAQAVKDKLDLAKSLGVRGVALFSLGGEDPAVWNILP